MDFEVFKHQVFLFVTKCINKEKIMLLNLYLLAILHNMLEPMLFW